MNKKVLIVGSAERSGGGVASVIKLMKKMSVWEKYHCYWLGTQIQRNYAWKLWYALKAYFIALFIIWRYDIVHFHTVPNISMKIQLPIFLLALLARKKIILHLHVGNQLEREAELKFKLFHWCMKKSDMIVLLAHCFKDLLEKNYAEIKTPSIVIYNPCENADTISYDKHEKTILFAGAFTNNKAADVLIDAFSMIQDKYPEWRLQILGSGPNESLYRKKIEEYELSPFVDMPGYIKGEKKKAYFQKAGIYVMCSYLEGFPMVVLEAWSYGVPVVTTPVGGLPDVLIEGSNSLVFDYGNAEELAQKLDTLMCNDILRGDMSKFSINYVLHHFSKNVVNNQLDMLYKSL